MWGKVSCLRKQHDGRDWAPDHQPSYLKSSVLTTTPPRPPIWRSECSGNCSLLKFESCSCTRGPYFLGLGGDITNVTIHCTLLCPVGHTCCSYHTTSSSIQGHQQFLKQQTKLKKSQLHHVYRRSFFLLKSNVWLCPSLNE